MPASPQEILITLGDPAGIGPEIVLATLQNTPLQENRYYRLFSHPSVREWFSHHLRREDILWEEVCPDIPWNLSFGQETPDGGRIAYESLCRAIVHLKEGRSHTLVTAPLAKRTVHLWDPHFVDHTTFLASAFHVQEYRMAFWGQRFGVVLETIHLPLREVSDHLSLPHVMTTIDMAYHFASHLFGEQARLALCGLNPHAGEKGLLGTEEITILEPAIATMREKGIPIDGPLPADTVFHQAMNGIYQVVIAMYHDQGLAPFKMVSFDEGVNVTLGLPFVRTSPDHGTAFALAGQGIASPKSMQHALHLAIRLS